MSACRLIKTVRRLKTYAGTQGYVYQYYFVGRRAALANDPEAPATEFVFDVTSDRKLTYAVSVFLPEKAVTTLAAAHGRPLTETRTIRCRETSPFPCLRRTGRCEGAGPPSGDRAALLEEALASLGVE